MFAVPKDTQLLIFFVPDLTTGQSGVKKLEERLTEKTGIPCIVLPKWVWDRDPKSDFELKSASPKEPKEPIDHPDLVLHQEADDKGRDGDDRLDDRDMKHPLRGVPSRSERPAKRCKLRK